jgi:hypothetical protein
MMQQQMNMRNPMMNNQSNMPNFNQNNGLMGMGMGMPNSQMMQYPN